MDLDHLCMPGEPMRGQPEMTPPEALTLPGATAAYIAKLEAQVEALTEECAAHRDIGPRVQAACNQALLERDQAKARVAELVALLDAQYGTPCEQIRSQETIRRLADELATYKAAFIDLGIEMRSFGFVDCWHDGAQEVATHSGDATDRAFSAPALMSGPYMGDD